MNVTEKITHAAERKAFETLQGYWEMFKVIGDFHGPLRI